MPGSRAHRPCRRTCQAARLLEVVDFLSVGTSDLSPYALAADRMNGALADLLDPWQPALL